jgi:hypothetical protein
MRNDVSKAVIRVCKVNDGFLKCLRCFHVFINQFISK